ncbi:hypothetical protein DFH09DRAFT_478687 [Mycena vulgaris]|nr:hypothetical protein DFH09DRAFT_478687 [Mycena vulgaris]
MAHLCTYRSFARSSAGLGTAPRRTQPSAYLVHQFLVLGQCDTPRTSPFAASLSSIETPLLRERRRGRIRHAGRRPRAPRPCRARRSIRLSIARAFDHPCRRAPAPPWLLWHELSVAAPDSPRYHTTAWCAASFSAAAPVHAQVVRHPMAACARHPSVVRTTRERCRSRGPATASPDTMRRSRHHRAQCVPPLPIEVLFYLHRAEPFAPARRPSAALDGILGRV